MELGKFITKKTTWDITGVADTDSNFDHRRLMRACSGSSEPLFAYTSYG